jgi:hypothetical protein
MGATKSPGQTSSVIAVSADDVQKGLAKSMIAPKKMLEANLRAGSALLSFASQRMQAQAEFLGRFMHCDSLEQAAAMQTKFFETMVSDYGREMNELMEIARDNSAFLGAAVEPPKTGKAA